MFKYLVSLVCASLLTTAATAQVYISPLYRPAYGYGPVYGPVVRQPVIIQNRPVVQNRLYLNYNFNSFNNFGNYSPYYGPTYNPYYNNFQNNYYTPEYLRWRFLTYGF